MAYEVIADEIVLESLTVSLKDYLSEYKEILDSAIRRLKLCGEEWNDEDYNSLLSAINSFKRDLENISKDNNSLFNEINKKIDAIHELHQLKI